MADTEPVIIVENFIGGEFKPVTKQIDRYDSYGRIEPLFLY